MDSPLALSGKAKGTWGAVIEPIPLILNCGYVSAVFMPVVIVHRQRSQLMSVVPPKPALHMIVSRCGIESRSFVANARTELKDVKSTNSGRTETRLERFSSHFSSSLPMCFWRLATVSSAFLASRVVGMRVRDWKGGRVWTNSSISRRQIAKPRPLSSISRLLSCTRLKCRVTCWRQ